jgi:hypothetical protein
LDAGVAEGTGKGSLGVFIVLGGIATEAGDFDGADVTQKNAARLPGGAICLTL